MCLIEPFHEFQLVRKGHLLICLHQLQGIQLHFTKMMLVQNKIFVIILELNFMNI
jgi:hypothetical protein